MSKNKTVFLIDDDSDDQEIFSFALKRADDNTECIFANDGIEAIEKIKKEESFIPDFIFIDMNMPRMNGSACLAEIRKIERIRKVPVYIYSTASDPVSIEENMKLGAKEFIVKPSNIDELTGILKKIISNKITAIIFLFSLFLAFPSDSHAQVVPDSVPGVGELKKLSVEELMNIVVTSVSRTPEVLSEVPSAIQVITGEDIRRSSSKRLPEALRLASNLQVSQAGSYGWGITARGFNGAPIDGGSLANKLLVMIDGRSVYTPLFGGVFWDVQNTLLEDINRIEVISGPGGSIWGANAVNGIVNVISKRADETQGFYISGSAGNLLQDHIALRYGFEIDSGIYLRIYGQRYDYNSTEFEDGTDANDSWNISQGGFRMDHIRSEKNHFTLQGDIYGGEQKMLTPTNLDGQNILGRWVHTASADAGYSIQLYYDRTYRHSTTGSHSNDEMNTYDFDFDQKFSIGKYHRILWGVGARIQNDILESDDDRIGPEEQTLELFTGFIQDQITIINDKLDLTIGSKFIQEEYSGFDFQPSARLALKIKPQNTIWAAVSRSVRTPTRIDVDYQSRQIDGSENFRSENLVAYEAGYRFRPAQNFNFSIAVFYNDYSDLRTLDSTVSGSFVFGNNIDATTAGIEISGNLVAYDWWRIRGGYSFINKEFKYTSDKVLPGSEYLDAVDPQHYVIIQSIMDLPHHLQFDITGRYADRLDEDHPGVINVDSYLTFNARIAWNYKAITIAVAGQNLAEERNHEMGASYIPRSIYGNISLRF